MNQAKMLSQSAADAIMTMISVEKRFAPGDKLPNESELALELQVSRGTLREAVKILSAQGIVEIKRGKGTFVTASTAHNDTALSALAEAAASLSELYEMRLIFEPEAAYLAALRGTDGEIKRILALGQVIAAKIAAGEDRTQDEQAFHQAIAQATHNTFMNQLMPILHQAIAHGVIRAEQSPEATAYTQSDHRLLMDFLAARNASGARSAMQIHILHAMAALGLENLSAR